VWTYNVHIKCISCSLKSFNHKAHDCFNFSLKALQCYWMKSWANIIVGCYSNIYSNASYICANITYESFLNRQHESCTWKLLMLSRKCEHISRFNYWISRAEKFAQTFQIEERELHNLLPQNCVFIKKCSLINLRTNSCCNFCCWSFHACCSC